MCAKFLQFTDDQLKEIFNKPTVLTKVKRTTLEEFCAVFDPFDEATVCLQKDAFSIGHVIPIYRGESRFLNK